VHKNVTLPPFWPVSAGFLPDTRQKETGVPHSSTVSFLSYWRGLQSSPDKAPPRAAFDPAHLKGLIPQMIMISDAEGGHRFRLSGGFVVALHGHELKDASFAALFRQPFVDTLQTALILARRREQPLILSLSAPWHGLDLSGDGDTSHNDTIQFEICLCPMTNRDGVVDRFVGIYQTVSAPPRNPYGKIGQYTLVSSRLYEPRQSAKAGHLQLVAAEGKRIA
jgi:hypothetical protein